MMYAYDAIIKVYKIWESTIVSAWCQANTVLKYDIARVVLFHYCIYVLWCTSTIHLI